MVIGKRYNRYDKGHKITFPFKEVSGEFMGYSRNGWLKFKLSGKRTCSINGGHYKEVSQKWN